MTTELDQLENQAAALDADAVAADPSAPPEAEAVPVDLSAEVAALIQTVAGMLTPAFPCLAEIYTTETCKRLGDAAAPVMEKYDLTMGGLFDRYGPEITLAAVAFPIAIATAKGIKQDMANRRNPAPVDTAPAYAQERAGEAPTP